MIRPRPGVTPSATTVSGAMQDGGRVARRRRSRRGSAAPARARPRSSGARHSTARSAAAASGPATAAPPSRRPRPGRRPPRPPRPRNGRRRSGGMASARGLDDSSPRRSAPMTTCRCHRAGAGGGRAGAHRRRAAAAVAGRASAQPRAQADDQRRAGAHLNTFNPRAQRPATSWISGARIAPCAPPRRATRRRQPLRPRDRRADVSCRASPTTYFSGARAARPAARSRDENLASARENPAGPAARADGGHRHRARRRAAGDHGRDVLSATIPPLRAAVAPEHRCAGGPGRQDAGVASMSTRARSTDLVQPAGRPACLRSCWRAGRTSPRRKRS